MTEKQYEIPYNDEAKTWDPLEFSARVVNAANGEVQNIKPDVRVEDASNGGYAAIRNNVLIVDNVSVQQRIESGDHAQITLRLNDGDPKIGEVIQRNSKFQLKVTMFPEFEAAAGTAQAEPIPVEGLTEIVVQLPQTWELTFKKAFWTDAGVIDLKVVENVAAADLRDLGECGGRLILKPRGLFDPPKLGEQIRSNSTIANAGACTLDRGEGVVLDGQWDPGLEGYLFEIQSSRTDTNGPVGDLILDLDVKMLPGYEERMGQMLSAAKAIGGKLGQQVPQRARTFIQGLLDLLAKETEESLVERKGDITPWLINISRFIEFMQNGTGAFDRSLKLFDEAFKRFVGNMINFAIELIFFVFDKVKAVKAKGSTEKAVKHATKELVEEAAEKEGRDLGTKLVTAEQGEKTLREQFDNVSRKLGETVYNPPPQSGMDDWLRQIDSLRKQQVKIGEEFAKQTKEVADLRAAMKITKYVEENSADFATKEFRDRVAAQAKEIPNTPEIQNLFKNLEAIKEANIEKLGEWGHAIGQELAKLPDEELKALRKDFHTMFAYIEEKQYVYQLEVLSNFNTGLRDDLLIKGPLGQRMQKISEEAEAAKKSAEELRYKHVPFIHYEGWLAPLWFAMDWVVEQIVWLYDLAKKWIPGVAEMETMLIWALDLFLGYMMKIINSLIDFMNGHTWSLSSINPTLRPRAVDSAISNGVGRDFFAFPTTLSEFVSSCRPDEVVGMANNATEKGSVKNRIRANAEGGYGREKENQKRGAKSVFTKLCVQALDISHLANPAPNLVHESTASKVWGALLGPMANYEKDFKAAGATGTDYLTEPFKSFVDNSTFQDWDGAVEWIAWSISWILRLGALGAIASGVAAPAAVGAFGIATAVEQTAALIRPAISWLATMPDVIGLQFDVVLAATLMFSATIEGDVNGEEIAVKTYIVGEGA